ncbi:MAG: hypothetical protein R3B72_12865 [Polyangiaceae bacterium]
MVALFVLGPAQLGWAVLLPLAAAAALVAAFVWYALGLRTRIELLSSGIPLPNAMLPLRLTVEARRPDRAADASIALEAWASGSAPDELRRAAVPLPDLSPAEPVTKDITFQLPDAARLRAVEACDWVIVVRLGGLRPQSAAFRLPRRPLESPG